MESPKGYFGVLVIILTILIFHCDYFSTDSENEWHNFKGKIVYNDFEGGFYGILTDDGERLDPLNLDEKFTKEGITVEGKYKERRDLVSYHMWGIIVEVKNIRISY